MQIPGIGNFVTSNVNYFLESSWKGKTVQVFCAASILTLIYFIALRKKTPPNAPGTRSTSLSGRVQINSPSLSKEPQKADLSSIKTQVDPSITCTPEEFKRLLSENHRFPPKVIVTGDLHLRNSGIETLPTGLEIRGNLNLSGCVRLTSQGLIVRSNLLTTLPQGLKVGGDLHLFGCTNLISLPQGLKVGGDLNLRGCTSLTSLPQELEVGGNLTLQGCTSLTSLPSWITTLDAKTNGDTRVIDLENTGLSDTIIERLGETPAPGMQFIFSHAASTSLSGRVQKNSFSLSKEPQKADLSSIKIQVDPSIACTPEEFKRLLSENHQFPPKVIVTGDLDLRNSGIETLPTGLEIRGNLNLSRRTSLTSLPQGLVVRGNLHLIACTGLISLPQGLKVGGNLNLSKCTSLTSLPNGLEVRGNLELYMCTNLTSLHLGLKVGGNLNLRWCTSSTSLPSWITTLGARTDGGTRIVDLEGTGLSDAIIERLHRVPAPGMQFRFSHAATKPTITLATLDETLAFWFKEAKNKTLAIPSVVIDLKNRADVIRFLARLTETAEYKNVQTRQHLACRILETFHQMTLDDEIKARACIIIHQGLTSRDARIISALEEIELMLLIHKIENTNHNAEELKKLGKSFLLLEMVNEKAKSHKETLKWVDEIEVYLAFQIGLAERFNLPVKTRNMIFKECAQVTDDQLKTFGDEIEHACTDEKLEAFLKNWNPWVMFDRKTEALIRLRQIEVMGNADEITGKFEAKAQMLQFNLDAVLQRYPAGQDPIALCSFFHWAEADEFKWGPFITAIRLEQFEDLRGSDQYVMAKDLLGRLNSYFAQKKAQVIVGSQAEIHLKEQFKESVDKIIDAYRNCIDQMVLQLQELMLNIIADDFTTMHRDNRQQERMLFRAGHELCKYRMNLLKEICIRQNPIEQHEADLELAIMKELSDALDDVLGMHGSIFKIGSQYINLLDDVHYRAYLVLCVFWEEYQPLEYLAEQLKTAHGNINILRNELSTWAMTHYGIEDEDAEHPAKTDMNPRLVENYNPNTFSDFINGGEWTSAATFLLLEAAGLVSEKQAGTRS